MKIELRSILVIGWPRKFRSILRATNELISEVFSTIRLFWTPTPPTFWATVPIFGSDFGSKRAQTGIFSIVYALFTSKTYYNRFNSQKQLQARISCTIFVVGVLFSFTVAIHPHSKIAAQCIGPLRWFLFCILACHRSWPGSGTWCMTTPLPHIDSKIKSSSFADW